MSAAAKSFFLCLGEALGRPHIRCHQRLFLALMVMAALLHVTHRTAYSQTLLQTFAPSENAPSTTRFGGTVLLDGNRVLVGDVANTGQVHLFDADTGQFQFVLDEPTPSESGNSSFGAAIASQGNLILVGAPEDSTVGQRVGQAHLFDATSGNLLRTINDPNVTGNDQFGSSVAIDGSHLFVGSIGEAEIFVEDEFAGLTVAEAYMFDAVSGDLVRTFVDPTPTSFSFDSFGSAIAVSGDLVVVAEPGNDGGAGQVHLYDRESGGLIRSYDDPTPDQRGNFGRDVAISGSHLLIGELGDALGGGSQIGEAHLFGLDDGELITTFGNPTPADGDFFGDSLDIDGNYVLIGAQNDNTLGVNVGQAYLFDIDGNLLATIDDPTVSSSDRFGADVSIDGGRFLIGSPNDSTAGSLNQLGEAQLFAIPEPSVCNFLLMLTCGILTRRRR